MQNLSREKNGLTYKDQKILVFPDLPLQEALVIRKSLKPTTLKLKEVNVKYKWHTPGKLVVRHDNKQYFSWDEESGKQLLLNLSIDEPMKTGEKKTCKRKISFQTLPHKGSKILVHPAAGASGP